ncbi:MAG: hypothetical protein ABSG41_19650 [Bryobacteraceae bacterium]
MDTFEKSGAAKLRFFRHSCTIAILMDEQWKQVVIEALSRAMKTSEKAVPGAKLREIIARVAAEQGLRYPAAGHEEESFSDFLKYFDSVLLIRRRKGEDFLVAPVDMPQLLLDVSDSAGTRVREDMFEAFTRIPRGTPPTEPWYVPDNDTVEWLAVNEQPGLRRLIRIPPSTLDQELEERRAFVQSSDIEGEVKDRIVATLSSHAGLGSFAKVIGAYGLARKWHAHRFQSVVRRMKAWCEAEHVPWREQWIVTSDQWPAPTVATVKVTEAHRNLFGKFVEALSEEDLRRISVPLDIVLKIVRK